MTNDQPYLPRPGIDERAVVAEMIRDPDSLHWTECWNFVKLCVYANAKNIPGSLHEDIIQETMYRIAKYLPHFRLHCSLKTWVNLILVTCIIDEHRRLRNEASYPDSPDEGSHESEEPGTSEEKSAEEIFMINDEIHNGWAACLEYTSTRANSTRNQLIIWMVIHEGKTHAEAAKAAGCTEPVVGYVVRGAQRYAREKMEHRQQA
ncbi:MAG: RNA polymerase sigma factor [Ktedonobacteraceae bacterium]